MPLKFETGIKVAFSMYFIFISKMTGPFESWHDLPRPTTAQKYAIAHHFHSFFIASVDPIIMSVTEKYLVSNEESLIDRDSNIFDTEITISPISMSRSNLSNNVGKHIPFLELV
jgi:hypothetical protein